MVLTFFKFNICTMSSDDENVKVFVKMFTLNTGNFLILIIALNFTTYYNNFSYFSIFAFF